ncbi:MAG: helix-turn-helix transcriptional regulator [Lachnospiraceae bacterium]|nr:helix-turn-helix transcriptional regulator [Lachnospiraceae bacterium]
MYLHRTYEYNKIELDNLIASGNIEPPIVVIPSFTKCCYENRVHLDLMQSDEAIYRAGVKVLSDYHRAFSGNREICNHMEKARSYIREHLSEKLTLSAVAGAVHISGPYLSHIFSTLAGQSFCDYICDERLSLARHLLSKTNDTVDEISIRCGFSTPNYFSMVFKKHMGETPSAYRKNLGR